MFREAPASHSGPILYSHCLSLCWPHSERKLHGIRGYLYFRWALAQFMGQNGTHSWKQYHQQQEVSVTLDLGLN